MYVRRLATVDDGARERFDRHVKAWRRHEAT